MQTLTNKVQLIGRLGMDPEIKTFENGKLMRVSIATDDSYTDKNGQRVQDTQWHTLIGWNNMADLGEKLLKKGKQIAVEGKLINRSYDDKDGNKRYTTEIRIDQFLLLDKKDD